MRLIVYAVAYTTLATAGLVVLRRSLEGASAAEVPRIPGVYVGGLLYAASFGTFLLSLRHYEVLTVFPLFSGFAYATVAVAAAVFLDEPLTLARVAGILLVAGGAVLLVR